MHERRYLILNFVFGLAMCGSELTNTPEIQFSSNSTVENSASERPGLLSPTTSTQMKPTAHTTQRLCPEQCLCGKVSLVGYNVFCTKAPNSLVSNYFPDGVVYFTYTHSMFPLNVVRNNTFSAFLNLTSLDLSNNNIRSIEADAFHTLKDLRALILDNNPLASSDPSFLYPISANLRHFSICGIVERNQKFNWSILTGNKCKGDCKKETGLHFGNLQTLKIDRNEIDRINVHALEQANALRSLQEFSLSKNILMGEVIGDLIWIIQGIKNQTKENHLQASNKREIGHITINLSNNNISHLGKVDLDMLKKYSTLDGQNSSTPRIQILLAKNPINCKCKIKDFMIFLFKRNGTTIVMDSETLVCKSPPDLAGIELSYMEKVKVHYCHGDWGNKGFKLSPAQLAFIIVCSTTLCFVSLAVLYLNRHKCATYWNILKNCGEDDEDYRNKIRCRNKQFTNKYSIPLDHKGIGHSGYFTEEVVIY